MKGLEDLTQEQLLERAQELQADYQNANRLNAQLRKEKAADELTIKEQGKMINSLRSKIEDVEMKVQRISEQRDSLKSMLTSTESKVKQLTEDIEIHKRRAENFSKLGDNLSNENSRLSNEVMNMTRLKNALQTSLSEILEAL